MRYSAYNPSTIEEINRLFIQTSSNSEDEAEGLTIGELTNNYMTNTDADDFYCFVATDYSKFIVIQ